MRPRALTDEAIARIHQIEEARRAVPTRQQLADELGVSKSLVDKVAKGYTYSPRETLTTLQIDKLAHSLVHIEEA